LRDRFHQCRCCARPTTRLEFTGKRFHRFTAARDEYEIVSVVCSLTRKGSADASRRAGYERNRTS
jgi:hypothetical protein